MPERDSLEIATRLHRGATRLGRALRASRRGVRLSLSRQGVLARLRAEGELTASALAASLGVQKQSLTRLVADLARQELIERRGDPADRRQNLLAITAKGRARLQEEVEAQRAQLAATMERALTPAEQAMLDVAAELMERLAAALEAPE